MRNADFCLYILFIVPQKHPNYTLKIDNNVQLISFIYGTNKNMQSGYQTYTIPGMLLFDENFGSSIIYTIMSRLFDCKLLNFTLCRQKAKQKVSEIHPSSGNTNNLFDVDLIACSIIVSVLLLYFQRVFINYKLQCPTTIIITVVDIAIHCNQRS